MNVNKNSPYRQTDFNKNKVGQFMLAQVGQFWLALKVSFSLPLFYSLSKLRVWNQKS